MGDHSIRANTRPPLRSGRGGAVTQAKKIYYLVLQQQKLSERKHEAPRPKNKLY